MNFSESIKRILPFGSLFLVGMGLMSETIFYNKMGINIIRYSTVMDILLSPVAILTSNPIILLIILGFMAAIFGYTALLFKFRTKKWAQMMSGVNPKDNLSDADIIKKINNLLTALIVIAMLSFFLGTGLGSGTAIAERIKSGQLNYKNKLTFSSGESEEVYLMHTNTMYFFYVSKNSKIVKITPIGNIKTNEFINNEKLQ